MKIKRYFTTTFRPPLVSDNLNDTLKMTRFFAHPLILIILVLLLDAALFCMFTFLVNIISAVPEMIKNPDSIDTYLSLNQIKPKTTETGKIFTIGFSLFLLILDITLIYKTRVAFSGKAINKGNSGTSRWTTLKEIIKQYKEIELHPSETRKMPVSAEDYRETKLSNGTVEYEINKEKQKNEVLKLLYDKKGKPKYKIVRIKTNWFPGKGGMPVARWRDKLYIDYQTTNNLFLGATRSGKGEMFVFTMIDIFSRAEKQINRPSMIIFDPKLELYKSSFKTLQDRNYKVRLLNLDNPMKSAGYNPLEIVTEYYKKGKIDEAQQLAKSFAYNIFNANKDTQEAIWKNTATDLFTALIISVVSDCVADDENLNATRNKRYIQGRHIFDETRGEEREEHRSAFAKVYLSLKEGEDFLDETNYNQIDLIGIPDYIVQTLPSGIAEEIKIEYKDIYPNEKNINCFSALNFFKELVDVNSESTGKDAVAGAKQAETALDDYFNARPDLDYAKALYASIKSAGDRTKGSIYVNMQSALTIFSQDNIARLSAESDINIRDLGFDKEHPSAVFIGLPTEDKANHFFAVNFVTQVFQYLWKISKEGTNKLDREVTFILDEFGNMPVFDNFDGMVTNCLGAGLSFNIFIQSYNQLHAKYELDMDTIKDNFANQFYIMAVGQESANEFSEQLGNKTIIELQRSGSVFGLKKSIMENPKERPLLFPAELQNFQEGETALIRAAKRTDRAGAGIRSYPIFDEYMQKIYFWHKIDIFVRKLIIKRLIRRDKLKDRDTKETLTAAQEYAYWYSYKQRWYGTAFMYRWQYATDDFPNPTDVRFDEVFSEKGRDTIDYENRVVDIRKVKEKLGIDVSALQPQKSIRTLADLDENGKAKFHMLCRKYLGDDYADRLRIAETMKVEQVFKIIKEYCDQVDEEIKKVIKADDFVGKLDRTLMK